ncbi:MAG TPA: (4Fe-4S)-binding protein, partial [Spirochaetota bacterium]|nr:(4Fe-4S)-binding protein [Spirochaetota bacterium]
MQKIILYYLSGTGNTFRVVRWMCDAAAKKNFDAVPVAVEHADPRTELTAQVDIVGIGMPTHGFTLPWKVLKFLLHIPRGKGAQAFAFATRAGAKYGPIPGYPPGIAGSSIFIAALVLALKGYRVRGIMSVNMPSNWMSLHSGLRADIVQTIIGKARPRAEAFIEKITGGKTVFFTGNVLYELVCALALSWISAGYLFIGRFSLAKL